MFVLVALVGAPWATAAADEAGWVGSDSCRDCHAEAYAAWQTSHHYRAMQPANEENVLGDFADRRFEYGGVSSRFFRRDGKYYVETDDAAGELREFEVAYTFGFEPLQQYLIAFPGGRYQALNVVWDNRPATAGGQRWVHLYPDPDDPVMHDDLVHWTGSFQNWNSRCAVCHSTKLEKNYNAASAEYRTSWGEINIACEACHGPAAGHLAWAEQAGKARTETAVTAQGPAHKGFAWSLADRGAFGATPDAAGGEPGPQQTLARIDGGRPTTQVETCAACHSRRSELGPVDTPGPPFDDRYHLALIEPGLYFPDGQVRDEVYVYGSFLQSRMHAAGVVCTDCHDPHSNRVRSADNSLCAQCHRADVFDAPAHHRHAAGSPGSACVDCHMPARTYMVVDDRRDHSFRVPEPQLSLELGVPNACNGCHAERDAQWAQSALESWGMGKAVRATHARALAAGWAELPSALPDLLTLAADTGRPAILRASAVLASGNFPSREAYAALAQSLYDDEALVRAAAVRALDWAPLDQRYTLMKALVADDSKSVRLAVARQLAGVPAAQLPAAEAKALEALRQEYRAALRFNADMPEEQMNLALFLAANGDSAAAEQAYRRALELAPAYVPALLNFADLYRSNGLDDSAEPLLRRAVENAPNEAPPQHAMGLLLIRRGDIEAALPYLARASEFAPQNVRYGYVYGVALWEAGQRDSAVSQLEQLLATHPGNPELVSALGAYYRELGETEKLEALQQP
jgi:predicted CXXCH cytochrome family protein